MPSRRSIILGCCLTVALAAIVATTRAAKADDAKPPCPDSCADAYYIAVLVAETKHAAAVAACGANDAWCRFIADTQLASDLADAATAYDQCCRGNPQ